MNMSIGNPAWLCWEHQIIIHTCSDIIATQGFEASLSLICLFTLIHCFIDSRRGDGSHNINRTNEHNLHSVALLQVPQKLKFRQKQYYSDCSFVQWPMGNYLPILGSVAGVTDCERCTSWGGLGGEKDVCCAWRPMINARRPKTAAFTGAVFSRESPGWGWPRRGMEELPSCKLLMVLRRCSHTTSQCHCWHATASTMHFIHVKCMKAVKWHVWESSIGIHAFNHRARSSRVMVSCCWHHATGAC
jgi:hypothetical protein